MTRFSEELLAEPSEQLKLSSIYIFGWSNELTGNFIKYTSESHRNCKLMKYQDHTIDNYIKDNMDKMYEIEKAHYTPTLFNSRYSLCNRILEHMPIIFVYDYYDRQFHIKIADPIQDSYWVDFPDDIAELRKYSSYDMDTWDDDKFNEYKHIVDKFNKLPIIIFDRKSELDGVIICDMEDYYFYKNDCYPSLGVNLLNSNVVKNCLKDFFDADGVIKPYCWYYFIRDRITDSYRVIRDLKRSPKKQFNDKGELKDAVRPK